jgi:hypothetical protein
MNPFRIQNTFQTSFARRITGNTRAFKIEEAEALSIIALLVAGSIGVMAAGHFGPFSVAGGAGSGGITACSNVSYTTPEALKVSDAAANAGGSSNSLTGPNGNLFFPNGNQFQGAENPGSLSSAVTTSGSYSLQSGDLVQITSTGAAPVWGVLQVPANGAQPYVITSQGNIAAIQVLPSSGATAGTCVWAIQGTQILAPSSGTSATTDVIAGVSTSDSAQSFATADGGNISSSQVTWTVTLNNKQAGVGEGYGTTVYSTSNTAVSNYASGAGVQVPQGQSVGFGMTLYVFANRTTFNLGLSTPGLSIQPITNTALTAATEAWVVTGFTGCNITTSSATTACLTAQFNVYNTYVANKHTAVTFVWVSSQQAGYGVAHATDPAVTGFPSLGAAYGIPSNFAGITVPTTYPDNGAPPILIEQSYTVIQYSGFG